MYKKILVPVEPSQGGKHALAVTMARHLADEAGAEITVLTVIEPVPGYFAMAESMPDIQIQAADTVMADLKAFVGDRPDVKLKVLHGHAATEILALAEKLGTDCIVIASHRPEFADFFLGSTAARVVRHAKCSVHVMR